MIDPIPELYDATRFEIRIAERLGVPVTELETVPDHYIAAARIDLAVDGIFRKRAQDEADKHKRQAGRRK